MTSHNPVRVEPLTSNTQAVTTLAELALLCLGLLCGPSGNEPVKRIAKWRCTIKIGGQCPPYEETTSSKVSDIS